jgi:tRNA 2-thiouridine synthesizing protein E
MAEKTIAGIQVKLTEDGYLEDASQWTEEIAKALASEENIELTDKHMEVIHYLREKYQQKEALTIRKVGKSGIVNIKEFYDLFPGGPLKKASKISGIPKPVSCV